MTAAATTVRVLHVVRPAAGGIRQHVLSLLRHMDRARFVPFVAAPADFLHSLPGPELAAPFPLEIAASFAPWADLRTASRLAALSRGADVVHAHGLRAGWVAALAHCRRPFPLVVTAHNLADGAGRLSRLGLRLIGRRAAKIVAVSEAVADSLAAQGVPRSKIGVIPNGVDVDSFAERLSRDETREALGVPPDAFVVGCIARLSPEKGVDVLLGVAAHSPGIVFLVAGDGPQRAALEARLPPNVRMLGRVADTRPLLGAVDVLAVPSRQEGQGIVALEAMAAGVPVVASRVGGLAGMLTDGATALLVVPDNPAALAGALARLQDDAALRQRLAVAGLALVREQYEVQKMARAVEVVYGRVLA